MSVDWSGSTGYQKLLAAVEVDEKRDSAHRYQEKLAWILERAEQYAQATGLDAVLILDTWESVRDYWYMNFYQDSKQPPLEDVRVFDTLGDAIASFDGRGFRCPSCKGVSRSPYSCDTRQLVNGKLCDWKVYGFFVTGVSIFTKDKMMVERIFRPIAWEAKEEVEDGKD